MRNPLFLQVIRLQSLAFSRWREFDSGSFLNYAIIAVMIFFF